MRTLLVAVLLLTALSSTCAGRRSQAPSQAGARTFIVAVTGHQSVVVRRYQTDSGGARQVSRSRLPVTDATGVLFDLRLSPDGRSAYGLGSRQSGSCLLQYHLDADGVLKPLSPPAVPIGEPMNVFQNPLSFSSDGHHAYASCGDGIHLFRVGPDGALTPLRTPIVVTGMAAKRPSVRRDVSKPGDKFSTYLTESGNYLSPISLTCDPADQFAYVINDEYYRSGFERVIPNWAVQGGEGNVDVARTLVTLRIGADGGLKPMGSPIPLPAGTAALSVSPDGGLVAASGGGSVEVFRVSLSGAARPTQGGVLTGDLAEFGAGQLFVTQKVGTPYPKVFGINIARYRLSRDHALVAEAPVVIPRLGDVTQMTVDRDGRFLCLECYRSYPDCELDTFDIGADGSVATAPSMSLPVGEQPGVFVAVSGQSPAQTPRTSTPAAPGPVVAATGDYVYVLNTGDSTISQYGVRADGTLPPLTPPRVPTGRAGFNWPEDQLAVGEAGRFLYVTHTVSGTLDQYRINPGGTLAPLSPPTIDFGFSNPPNDVFADPADHLLFVTDRDNPVYYLFHVQADGTLTPSPALARRSFISGNGSDAGIAVNPTTRLFSILHGNNDLDTYRYGPNGLAHLAHTQTNLNCQITFDPSGRFAYYGDGSGAVWQFRVDAAGAVTENNPPSTPADQAPQEVAITPNGQFAYAANSGDFYGDGSISQYRMNPDGTLAALNPPAVMTGASPRHLAIDDTGSFLYALSSSAHATDDQHPVCISEYRIAPDGHLLPLDSAPIPTGQGPGEIVIVHCSGDAILAPGVQTDALPSHASHQEQSRRIGAEPPSGHQQYRPGSLTLVVLLVAGTIISILAAVFPCVRPRP